MAGLRERAFHQGHEGLGGCKRRLVCAQSAQNSELNSGLQSTKVLAGTRSAGASFGDALAS